MKKRVPNLLVFLLIFTLFTSLFIIPLVFAESQTKWVNAGKTEIRPSDVGAGWMGNSLYWFKSGFDSAVVTEITLNIGEDSLIPILQDYVTLKQKNVATDSGFLNKLKAAPETQLAIRFPTGADLNLVKATKETMWSQLAEAKLGTLQKSGNTIIGFTPSTSEAGQKVAELLNSLDKAMYKSDSSGKITSSVQPGIAGLDIEKNGETATIYKIDKTTGARTPISSLSTSDPNQNQIVSSLFDFVTTKSPNSETQKKKECKLNDLLCKLPQLAVNLPNLEKEAATKSENQYLDVKDAIQETIDSLPPEITPEEKQAAKEKALQEVAILSGPSIEEQGAAENDIFQNTVLTNAQILDKLQEDATQAGDNYDSTKAEYIDLLMKYSNKQDKTDADRAALEAALKKSDAAFVAETEAFNKIAEFKDTSAQQTQLAQTATDENKIAELTRQLAEVSARNAQPTPTPSESQQSTTSSPPTPQPTQVAQTSIPDVSEEDISEADRLSAAEMDKLAEEDITKKQTAQTSLSSDKPWLSRAWDWLFGGSSQPQTPTTSTEPPAPTASEIPTGTTHITKSEFEKTISPAREVPYPDGRIVYYDTYNNLLAVKDKLGRYYVLSSSIPAQTPTPSESQQATPPKSTPTTPTENTGLGKYVSDWIDFAKDPIKALTGKSLSDLTRTSNPIAEKIPDATPSSGIPLPASAIPPPAQSSYSKPSQTPKAIYSPPTPEQIAAAQAAQEKYDSASKAYIDYNAKVKADLSQRNAAEDKRLWEASKLAQAERDAAQAQIAPPPPAQPQESQSAPVEVPKYTAPYIRGDVQTKPDGTKSFISETETLIDPSVKEGPKKGEGKTVLMPDGKSLVQIINGRPKTIGVLGSDGTTVISPTADQTMLESRTKPITIQQNPSKSNVGVGNLIDVKEEDGNRAMYSISETRVDPQTGEIYYVLESTSDGKKLFVSGSALIEDGKPKDKDGKPKEHKFLLEKTGEKKVYPDTGNLKEKGQKYEVSQDVQKEIDANTGQKNLQLRPTTSEADLQDAIEKEGQGVVKYPYNYDPNDPTKGDGSTRWYRPDGSLVAMKARDGSMKIVVNTPVKEPTQFNIVSTTENGKQVFEVTATGPDGVPFTAKANSKEEANALVTKYQDSLLINSPRPSEFNKKDPTQIEIPLTPGQVKIAQNRNLDDGTRTVVVTEVDSDGKKNYKEYYKDAEGKIRVKKVEDSPNSKDPIVGLDNKYLTLIEEQFEKSNGEYGENKPIILPANEEDWTPSTTPNTQSQDKLDYGFWCDIDKEGKDCQSGYCDPDMSVCAEPPTTPTENTGLGKYVSDWIDFAKDPIKALTGKSLSDLTRTSNPIAEKIPDATPSSGIPLPASAIPPPSTSEPTTTTDTSPVKQGSFAPDDNGNLKFKTSILPSAKSHYSVDSSGNIYNDKNGQNSRELIGKQNPDGSVVFYEGKNPDLTEYEYKKDKNGQYSFKNSKAKLTPIKINTIPTPTSQETQTQIPSKPETSATPSTEQPFELPPDWEEMGLTEEQYRKEYGLDYDLDNEEKSDINEYCKSNTDCISGYCDQDMSVCAEPPTGIISKLQEWSTDLLDLMGNPIKDLLGISDPITEKIDSQKPDFIQSTKNEIVGNSKYTLGSGTYDGKPATTYRDYDTEEILGYTQNGKYYRTSSPAEEGTTLIRNPGRDPTISTRDSEGNNKIYYLNISNGEWYEQIDEGSSSKDKIVDDSNLEMKLQETYESPTGRIFVPGTKPAGQLMQEGDECTDDSDCASNFCDKSEVVWVCGKAEFAPSPIAFGNCIPGESQNYSQTCEYCNEETSMWTDWCAEQGQICGKDEVGTCYDCVDDSREFYYNQETEPWSCSTCNLGGSWQYYCPDNTYCSESGNGKCYLIEDSLPPSQRECDPENPDEMEDLAACEICVYDDLMIPGVLRKAHWQTQPDCDLSTQYCDGNGHCLDLTQEEIDAKNAAETMTGCYDNGNYYEIGDPYWDPCPDGINSYVWGTCSGVDEWDSTDNWISYDLYCGASETGDITWTDKDCVELYGELYFYDKETNTCYYDDGDYILDVPSSDEDYTDTTEDTTEPQYDESGCGEDQACLDCYYADWYDQWYYC